MHSRISNCDFRFNVAESCGGAIFFYNTTNNNNFTGYFINNSALGNISVEVGNGGAITFKDTSCNSIFHCDFVNNTAALYGGAVNYRQTPHNITFDSDFINNNANCGLPTLPGILIKTSISSCGIYRPKSFCNTSMYNIKLYKLFSFIWIMSFLFYYLEKLDKEANL